MDTEKILEILEMNYFIEKGTKHYIWTGSRNAHGYGVVKVDKRLYYIHRLSAVLFFQIDIDDKSIQIKHECNNRMCFNPEHLIRKVVRIKNN